MFEICKNEFAFVNSFVKKAMNLSLGLKRPLEKALDFYVTYSSFDCPTNTKEEFRWNLTSKRLAMLKGVSIAVSEVIFPNSVYPINENNNKVTFNEAAGVTDTITIPSGGYSGTNIASTLQSLLNTAGTYTYTVTYDSITKKLTFAYVGGDLTFESVANDAYNELGIVEGTLTSSPLVATDPVSLQGPDWIEVRSASLSVDNENSGGYKNVIAFVPILVPFGSLNHFIPDRERWIHTNVTGLESLDIELFDARGNRYVLPGNAELLISFHIKPMHKL